MYHPFNFKTMECTVNDCSNKYCAFYHSEQEKKHMNKAQETFVQAKSKFAELNHSISKIGVDKSLIERNWNDNFGMNSANFVVDDDNSDNANSNIDGNRRGKKRRRAGKDGTAEHSKDRNMQASSKDGTTEHSKEGRKRTKSRKNAGRLGGGGKPETLRKNDKKSRFYLNQEVQMFEDIRTEFKNFTNLEFKIACNYICGFLNTFGGSLYFGINNDGYVKGINLTRQDIDDFQINLDVNLRKFTPKVFPDKYTLKWHEVASDSSCKKIIANKYVVEIEVKNVSSSGDVYVTGEQCCFIKRSGSLNNLTLAEIIEYLNNKHKSNAEQFKRSDDILNARNLHT